jgi:hypothetical protein|tara:strand:+ start:151 stop:483 length:333 start_codon:yes stop_codon:yes gene_type:complete
MNNKHNIGIIFLFVFLSLGTANAQNSKNRLHLVTTDYKCHVELIGGIQTIDFVNTKKQRLNHLAQSLVGKKKRKPFSITERVIYKVFECVPLNDNFTLAQSTAVDKKTPR